MPAAGRMASLLDPARWGLPAGAAGDAVCRLRRVWEQFAPCFRTRTRDTSEHGWTYLQGLLTMPEQRNFANIARRVVDPDADGQNLQQFVSDSPWSAGAVFGQLQANVRARAWLHGGTLVVDESADERAGQQSAGAGRQYLGREGKTDMGQVGVTLGYYKEGTWLMVDAELYLPENWFDTAHEGLRKRWHIPPDRRFATKPQMALAMALNAKANGLPFQVLVCDSTYGRDDAFRAGLNAAGILYIADILEDRPLYRSRPSWDVPNTPAGKMGRPFTAKQAVDEQGAPLATVNARQLAADPQWVWQQVTVRDAERGVLQSMCAAVRVWTLDEKAPNVGATVRQEWLLLRRDADGKLKGSLSNAAAETPLEWLAVRRAERYFAERIYQDAKSEGGWDELVARKYRAWMHHAALDAIALWYIAETKLDWAEQWPRDPALVQQLQVSTLPALSMANVRELLRAALPLPQLSQEQASRLVARHLVNRSKAKASRLRKGRSPGSR